MKRRKILGRLSLASFALAVPSIGFSVYKADHYQQHQKSFKSNPSLNSVAGMQEYPGSPLDQNGLFMNEEQPFWPSYSDVFKWKVVDKNPYKEEKKNSTNRLNVVAGASVDDLDKNSICWLGHASFLVHLNGIRILIDPVIGDSGVFLKRFSEVPFEKSSFTSIDYILISHNHRDHCDKDSVELLSRQNPDATWLCGLGLDSLLLNDWTGSDKIQTAGWYQQYQTGKDPVKISFLPTRHWSRRGLSDTNKSLWGAFMIESNGVKIYFGGDSGYGSHLKKVKALFGVIDYYLAGVGAFAPRWFMAPSHMHPEEVAQACQEIQPKNILPMHYGTFDLSDEPLLEPARLMKALKESNTFKSKLIMPAVGEEIKLLNPK